MTASQKTISSILKDLKNVHENLLTLSDDIWSSIDHNDTKKLDEGYQFKKAFNSLLDDFEKNKDEITALVSQFTGVKVEEKTDLEEKPTSENERLIKELNQNEPHEITEDFTFKRPVAFIFNGNAFNNLECWSELYIQFMAIVAKTFPQKLKALTQNEEYISKQGRKYYSQKPSDLRKSQKIMNDFYIEINLSAKDISKRIIETLDALGMKKSDITIFLRQDRNA